MTERDRVLELARRCGEEMAHYRRGEPHTEGFCVELFHGAVVRRDDVAWEAILDLYTDLVRRWLGSTPDGPAAHARDEQVIAVFERFWHAIDAVKFARFASLAAILQYLKMCTQSVRLDQVRVAARRDAHEKALDDAEAEMLTAGRDEAEAVAARLDGAAVWQAVQTVVSDERDRLVLYLSYAIGLTPRDICARHPAQFPAVAEVYLCKRRALDRLRRAAATESALARMGPGVGQSTGPVAAGRPKNRSGAVYGD